MITSVLLNLTFHRCRSQAHRQHQQTFIAPSSVAAAAAAAAPTLDIALDPDVVGPTLTNARPRPDFTGLLPRVYPPAATLW